MNLLSAQNIDYGPTLLLQQFCLQGLCVFSKLKISQKFSENFNTLSQMHGAIFYLFSPKTKIMFFLRCVRDARCVRTRPIEGSLMLSTWDFYGTCQPRPKVLTYRVREENSDNIDNYPYPIPQEDLP